MQSRFTGGSMVHKCINALSLNHGFISGPDLIDYISMSNGISIPHIPNECIYSFERESFTSQSNSYFTCDAWVQLNSQSVELKLFS